jgi:hypothetical protein
MNRLLMVLVSLALAGVVTVAHEGNDHVRGVVTMISAESNAITIRTAPGETRTLSLTDKTTFKQGAKTVKLEDVNVGDRVVADVRPKTAQIVLLQIAAHQDKAAK